MSSRSSRRDFLRRSLAVTGAAAALGVARGRFALAAPSPNAKLGVAVIGAGGMGGYSVDCALGERFVAMVDIDDGRIGEIMKGIGERIKDNPPKPKIYHDYRKMLDECHKDIDVVLIATPDHHHAPAAIRAINLGKDTFCQKPLTHNIYEAYALAKAAKERKVLTQMGNQGHCGDHIRRVCEYIWAGTVGDVTETHTILGRDFGGSGGRPPGKPIPAGVHWEEWIGPAPHRDYHDGLHPFSWRSWRQFGTGTIGDMACHNLDALFWALKIGEAKRYTIECLAQRGGSDEMFPQSNVVRWEIPARAGMPPVKVHAYDHGDLKPQVMLDAQKEFGKDFGEYTLFVGTKGFIGSDGRLLPDKKHEETPEPPRTIPRAHGGPIEDLYYAIRNDTIPCSNFIDSSGPLTAFALSGHLAMFAGVGKKLEWDVEGMRCTNMPEIDRFVRRTYRPGWEV